MVPSHHWVVPIHFFMHKLVNHVLAGVIGLAASLICALPMDAQAQTISNIATIQWDAGTTKVSRQSNLVSIPVDHIAPPPSLRTYQLDYTPSAQSLPVSATQCHGTSGTIPVTLDGAFAGTNLAPAAVKPSPAIRAGEPLFISLNSAADNLNATVIDTISVKLTTPSGDIESLTLA